jgi:hypothetical protein
MNIGSVFKVIVWKLSLKIGFFSEQKRCFGMRATYNRQKKHENTKTRKHENRKTGKQELSFYV